MARIFCAIVFLSVFHSWALAQAPAAPASPAGATTTIDQDKRGATTAESATPRTNTTSRPGNSPLPMSIKIQGDGIKMPACTAESRDGEACKK